MWTHAKTSRLSRISAFFLLGLGFCLLAYPAYSDRWNSLRQSKALAVYTEMTELKDEREIEAELQAAQAFNKKLDTLGNARFALKEDGELYEEYLSLMDVTGTGVLAYVEIPGYRGAQPVSHGTNEAVLQVAIGHLEGSSLPTGEPGTHAAYVGHDGLPSARLFTDITKMKTGDVFRVHVYDRVFAYEVDRIMTVLPEETRELEPEAGIEYATLITCVPYGVNSHRLLVRGHRIENDETDTPGIVGKPETPAPSVKADMKTDAETENRLKILLLLLGLQLMKSAYRSHGEHR